MTRILVVEDEERLARSIAVGLRDEGYFVDLAHDGQEALRAARRGIHEIVLLDVRLPLMSGFDVCARLRSEGFHSPILLLTACDAPADVVTGLDRGADDYVRKPFVFAELLARIRAHLRRCPEVTFRHLLIGDLRIDLTGRRVWRADKELALTSLEYRVLEHLARHAGVVQSRAQLLAAGWEDDLGPDSNVLEVIISNLRKKMDRGARCQLLHTRRGLGYVLSSQTP